MPKYTSRSHSKFRLKIHVIFCVKYRKRLLDHVGTDMKRILNIVASSYDFSIELMEVDKDHLHMLINFPPTITIVSIVRRLKQMSTRKIWDRHSIFLRKHFWRERTFWSAGYFACSVGEASEHTIRNYIESQG